MTPSDRTSRAVAALRARMEAGGWSYPVKTGDEYGNEWTVEHVDDDGKVLLSQEVTLDGEDTAEGVMDYLDDHWEAPADAA